MAEPQNWNDRYETTKSTSLSWFESKPGRSLEIILSRSGPGDAVIDVGAGTSTLVDHLLREQYAHVSLLDVSEAALEETRNRLGRDSGRVQMLVEDVTTWRPSQMYDLWHDRVMLHFLVEEEERQGYKSALLSALRPGGTLVIATYAPGGPERCSGLPVRHYDRMELEDFLGQEFVCHGAFTEDHMSPAGKLLPFHWAVFERRLD